MASPHIQDSGRDLQKLSKFGESIRREPTAFAVSSLRMQTAKLLTKSIFVDREKRSSVVRSPARENVSVDHRAAEVGSRTNQERTHNNHELRHGPAFTSTSVEFH